MVEKTELEGILDTIKDICEEHHMTFAQAVCEALYVFDPDLEIADNQSVLEMLNEFKQSAHKELEGDRL